MHGSIRSEYHERDASLLPVGQVRTLTVGRRIPSLLGWSVRALTHRPATTIFVAALVVRLGAIIVMGNIFDSSPVLDDETYSRMASEAAAGTDSRWDEYTHYLYGKTAALLVPITALYEVFGAHEFIGQIFVAFFGAAAAGLLCRLLTRIVPLKYAIIGGGLIAFLPSQVLWSSLILKDALVWFVLTAIALVVCEIAIDVSPRRLAVAAVSVIALLTMLAYLREHTLVVAVWALLLASWVGTSAFRIQRILGSLAIAIALPAIVGLGPLGFNLIKDPGDLSERRAAQAANANTAFVDPAPQAEEEPAPEGPDEASALKPQPQPVETGWAAQISHLPRGVSVMLFEPVPWGHGGSFSLKLARLEMLLWYPILLVVLLGSPLIARKLDIVLFPLLAGAGILAVYSLSEGNVGTAFRHRGEFTWVVALAFAIGVCHIEMMGRRRKKSV